MDKINLSIIIIGKNCENTLENCINHIKDSLNCSKEFINKKEIIYVDSRSNDKSIRIAKNNNIDKIIYIVDGYTSAALGRYLGIKYSNYENILFLDCDMYLDKGWFKNSFHFFKKYKAIIGERYEKLYKNNNVIKEIPNFYNIKKVEIAYHIGGFLMINREVFRCKNFTPLLPDEEEKDFYAKFFDYQKIYKIPYVAYIHNNFNLTHSRIKNYIFPFKKIGYILSLISSIKNGYFVNYVKLQKKYILIIIASILFYFGIITNNIFIFIFSFLFILFNGKKNLKGSIVNMIFFPYKFLCSICFLFIKHKIIIKINRKVYEEGLKL